MITLVRAVPDVIVVDVVLDDMHGLEFVRRLRERPRTTDVPTVLVGGDPAPAQAIAYGGQTPTECCRRFVGSDALPGDRSYCSSKTILHSMGRSPV